MITKVPKLVPSGFESSTRYVQVADGSNTKRQLEIVIQQLTPDDAKNFIEMMREIKNYNFNTKLDEFDLIKDDMVSGITVSGQALTEIKKQLESEKQLSNED